VTPFRFNFQHYWTGTVFPENGRSPLPGINIFITTNETLTPVEFTVVWDSATREIRAKILAEMDKQDAQPAHHR
jgi:hypothetical protein